MKRNLIVISGPSGAGEDSVIQGLERIFPTERVITTTSRSMRPGEAEGAPYHFVSREGFLAKVEAGEFFEYAEEDNRQWYGVTRAEIDRARQSGKLVIWKVDYKGVMTIKQLLPDVPCILITAPLDILEQRIRLRDNASEEFIRGRMEYARGWFEHRDIFDFEVENVQGKLHETIDTIATYIRNTCDIA